MAELIGAPFGALLRRMIREHEREGKVFDLPARKFWHGAADLDTSVLFHGRRASSPVGPAAGPQDQMAQNIVLSWLAGSRILELKTVQINDRLVLPRPCIDATTVGYNVEWSQELRLADSLREYVAGMMLITAAIAVPFTLSETRFARMNRVLATASGIISLVFGLLIVYEMGFVNGLFTRHPTWTPR